MCETAYVGRCNHLRAARCEILKLLSPQLITEFGLQNRVSACRAAADVGVGHRREFKTDLGQQLINAAVQFLGMLQCAGRLESDPSRSIVSGGQMLCIGLKQLDRVNGERCDPRGLSA